MDLYPILFNAQLVLIVVTLIVIVFDDRIKRWENKVIRRIKRRGGIRTTDGKVVCRDSVHRMSGAEIVRIINDVYD